MSEADMMKRLAALTDLDDGIPSRSEIEQVTAWAWNEIVHRFHAGQDARPGGLLEAAAKMDEIGMPTCARLIRGMIER